MFAPVEQSRVSEATISIVDNEGLSPLEETWRLTHLVLPHHLFSCEPTLQLD